VERQPFHFPLFQLSAFQKPVPSNSQVPLPHRSKSEKGTSQHSQLLSNFDKIAETPGAIKRLRSFILDLAVRGKLVPPACRQAGKTPTTLPRASSCKWWAYVIQCEDGSFYKGHTDNLPRRWKQHCAGTAADWTKAHPPKEVFYWEECGSKETAIKREKYLKSGSGREWFKREVVDAPKAWEPASELLKRIAAEKERLVKEKKIKKPKALPPIEIDEVPFEIPDEWEWIRLGTYFMYDAGIKTKPTELDQKLWLLELEDIEKDSGRLIQKLKASDRESKSTKSHFLPGDILYGKLRPYLNKAIVANDEGYSTTEIVAIRPYSEESEPHYTEIALRNPNFVAYVKHKGQGTKMPRLRTEDAITSYFPLPPLAEQKRIVAKVDELMALCDRLEAAQTERHLQRSRLVAATHHQINLPACRQDRPDGKAGSSDSSTRDIALPASLPVGKTGGQASFLFHNSNFNLHTSRPQDVSLLRQTILNLAVRGKLVEKSEDWKRLKLGEILCEPSSNGVSKGPTKDKSGTEVLRISAGTSRVNFTVNEGDFKHVHLTEMEIEKHRLKKGDLLACRYNGNLRYVGRFSIYLEEENRVQVNPDKLIRFRVSPSEHDSFFICYAMNAAVTRATIEEQCATTVGNIGISASKLKAVSIPIPPLAEQKRIVAKVDELMALCDALEAQLTASQSESQQLLEACLNEAIA
jgi:type I restriction enzyme S subunit